MSAFLEGSELRAQSAHAIMFHKIPQCQSKNMPKKDSPKKLRFLTFATRVEIIRAVQSGAYTQLQMANKLNVSPAAVCKIMKNKESILLQSSQLSQSDQQKTRVREAKYPLLDQCLFNWYTAAREDKVCSHYKRPSPSCCCRF
jgi:predicted transcriptional regulator